jgi:beta-exotoxin I transport system permease protein
MLNLLAHEIASRRTAMLGWGIGLALFGAMYVAIYPQLADYLSVMNAIPVYQYMGFSVDSLGGYLASAVVQFIPLMLVIYAVISSTATLVGEEENGTLELMVTMPLARWQIVSVKALALSVATLVILAIAGLGCAITFFVIKSTITTDISTFQLFFAILSGWPLVLAFLMIGLFLGAYLPSQRAASMVLTILVLIAYFGKTTALSLPAIAKVKSVFLFSHFDTSPAIFSKGLQLEGPLILLGVAAVFFVLAVLSFERRDITVGLWPWQRARRGGSGGRVKNAN